MTLTEIRVNDASNRLQEVLMQVEDSDEFPEVMEVCEQSLGIVVDELEDLCREILKIRDAG